MISSGRTRGTSGEDPLAKRLDHARSTHLRAIARLEKTLAQLRVDAKLVWLTDQVDATGYDLVIALGGDGTVLHASHQVGSTPMLALNVVAGVPGAGAVQSTPR